jgi:hypothetical protein
MPILGITASSVFISTFNFLKKLFITGADGTLRSTTGDLTTFTTDIPAGDSLNDISYNPTLNNYIVGGNNNRLLFSTDSISWTTIDAEFGSSNINNVQIAGDNDLPIGSIWTTQTSNFDATRIRSVAYGNNLWIAGGYTGQVRTSTDGTTWTTQTSNFGTTIIFSVAYGNSLWIAGGYTGQLRTSTDGTTWTTQTSNFGTTIIFSVAYGNSLWIAGGDTGTLHTSTDGVTWTTQTSNFGNTLIRSVAYGNNIWIAGGPSGQIRTSTVNQNLGIYVSTDGVIWTTQALTLPISNSDVTDIELS